MAFALGIKLIELGQEFGIALLHRVGLGHFAGTILVLGEHDFKGMKPVNREIFLERSEQAETRQTFLFEALCRQRAALANAPESDTLDDEENQQ